MASYVGNVYTKNCKKNLVILLRVAIINVMDGFWRFLFIFTLILCVLIPHVLQKHILSDVET